MEKVVVLQHWERKAVFLAGKGFPLREISRQLGLHESSVKKLLENMSRKINAAATTESEES